MGAAPGSPSVSEGPCLEPGHEPLSAAGVTARGLPECHLGPWCPYPRADSARIQGPPAGRAAQPWLFGERGDYSVRPPETALGTWPLDVGLLVGTSSSQHCASQDVCQS